MLQPRRETRTHRPPPKGISGSLSGRRCTLVGYTSPRYGKDGGRSRTRRGRPDPQHARRRRGARSRILDQARVATPADSLQPRRETRTHRPPPKGISGSLSGRRCLESTGASQGTDANLGVVTVYAQDSQIRSRGIDDTHSREGVTGPVGTGQLEIDVVVP
jgi:hypothetical protein